MPEIDEIAMLRGVYARGIPKQGDIRAVFLWLWRLTRLSLRAGRARRVKTYSMDLRKRGVAACDAGGATREQIAARFSVSVSWIRDLLRRRREAGSIAPKPRGGGRAAAFGAEAGARLRQAVRDDNDATLAE